MLLSQKKLNKCYFEPVVPTPYTMKIFSLFSTDPKCFLVC